MHTHAMFGQPWFEGSHQQPVEECCCIRAHAVHSGWWGRRSHDAAAAGIQQAQRHRAVHRVRCCCGAAAGGCHPGGGLSALPTPAAADRRCVAARLRPFGVAAVGAARWVWQPPAAERRRERAPQSGAASMTACAGGYPKQGTLNRVNGAGTLNRVNGASRCLCCHFHLLLYVLSCCDHVV